MSNLLNELGQRDKMRGLLSILTLYCNEFDKFKSTHARFYLSYDISRLVWYLIVSIPDPCCLIKIALKFHFCHKNVFSNVIIYAKQRCYGRHYVSLKIYKPLVVYRFYCTALFHSQTRHHIIIYVTITRNILY